MDEKKEVIRKESPLYSWEVQDLHGLGMSGLSDYDEAKFVDRKTGKIHFSTAMVIDKDIQWTSDGERLLFNGFLYDFCKEEEEPYFFYKVDDKPGDQFEVRFDVYRLIEGQYVQLLFAMITPMVNGVDGFAWINGKGIMYTQGGGHSRSSKALSVLNVLS